MEMPELSDMSDSKLTGQFGYDVTESSINMNFEHFNRLQLQHVGRHPDLEPIRSIYNFETDVMNDNPNIVFVDQKLFLKLNSTITINASYTPPPDNPQMFLRGMVVFSSSADMHLSVTRCANHRATTPNMGPESYAKECNVMKIIHPRVKYMGSDTGTTYGDRLSIYIPLDGSLFDPETNRVTEAIRLEFGCQNSCSSGINRRQTSAVFTLEDSYGQLVGKAATQFKVCSCPKRDAERDNRDSKRKNSNDAFPRGKKPKFNTPAELRMMTIKTEPGSDMEANSPQEGPTNSLTTEVRLNMPTHLVPQLLQQAHQIIASEILDNNRNAPNEELLTHLKGIEKLQKDMQRN